MQYIYAQPEWKHGWTVYQMRKQSELREQPTWTVKANYQEPEDNDPE